jgi:alpha-mannosidase
MTGRWPFTAEKIATRLDLIEPYIFRRKQALPNFRLLPLKGAVVDAPVCSDPSGWEEIAHESYWGRADLNFIIKSNFVVPEDWDCEHLALHLPLGVLGDIFNHPEGLLHIDGTPVGSADRYHHTIPLDAALQDGQRHVVSLHGWTGHAGWPADVTSKAKLFMGQPALVERHHGLLAFHQYASTVLDTVRTLDFQSEEHVRLLEALDRAFMALDTRDPIGDGLYDSVAKAADVLEEGVKAAGAPLDVTLHGIGHAHMDIAYLWTVDQIRLKNARTYSNVLRLMRENPDYRFSHSQPQLYDYTAQDYPALFNEIKSRVAEGRWEVMGGMWVEPDLNISGAEALVRQLAYGRKYFRDTFGDVDTPVLWLPDTFGFPAQIPQLMRHAGLKWFATNKLNWNQRNKVPSTTHVWEGIDGSSVLAQILTTPRSVQYLPFPTNYKSDLTGSEVLGTWQCSTAPEPVRDLPVCYGYGDGGGGPTEDLIAKARAFQDMPGMPKFRMSTVRDTFEAIEASEGDLPVWRGEHYMEGHRGVLTSQAWIKRANRKAEILLHEAEALAAMAGTKPDLDEAWKLLCLNQFHDIVTGTSIGQVFEDSRKDFARIDKLVEDAIEEAVSALADDRILIASTIPTTGPRLVLIDDAELEHGQQVLGGSLAFFENVQPYSLTSISDARAPQSSSSCSLGGETATLENSHVRVVFELNGQISEVFDKAVGRQVLAGGERGNVLQTFEDRPICWDAWDIDPFFEDRQHDIDEPCDVEILEDGPLRSSLKFTRRWRNSTITQIVRLAAHSARVDFETQIDWHETHTLLKAAFPTSVQAATAEFDVQWGSVKRSTSRDTDFDAARFEVPLHKWVQLSQDGYRVAVLNDCKYGCDVHGNTIRLTLIKSATYPDPNADQGDHRFTYSLLPNPGSKRSVLNHEAYDLNGPARVIQPGEQPGEEISDRANAMGAFIVSSNDQIIIETVKPAAEGSALIIRGFECAGEQAQTELRFSHPISSAKAVDFHEAEIEDLTHDGDSLSLTFKPHEIRSIKIEFA